MAQKILKEEEIEIKLFFKEYKYKIVKKRTFDFLYTKNLNYDYMSFKFNVRLQKSFNFEDGGNYLLKITLDTLDFTNFNIESLANIDLDKIYIEIFPARKFDYNTLKLQECFEIITKVENYIFKKLKDKSFISSQYNIFNNFIRYNEKSVFFSAPFFSNFTLGFIEIANENYDRAKLCYEYFVLHALDYIKPFEKNPDYEMMIKYVSTRIQLSNEIINLIENDQKVVYQKYADILSKLDKELKW